MKNILLIFLLSFNSIAYSQKIKLATLIPKGTNWANTLKTMADEIKKSTEGKVKLKIYYGGVQGDEVDVLRKTRIGQLHGGVSSDVRSVEVPFNFYHDEKKAMNFLTSNKQYFNQEIEKSNFVNLGFYGIGKVYVVSTKEVSNIQEMKGIKMWAWEGDKVVRAMMDSLELVSVPLALPDVMSSLSTGIIDAAYAPPLGILALQWQNKVKYLIDFPTAYSIGALLLSQKQWKKVSPEHQKIVKKIAKKHIDKANELAISDNQKSLKQLKEMGIKFISFSEKDLSQAEKIREDVISKLDGSVLSKKIIQTLESNR